MIGKDKLETQVATNKEEQQNKTKLKEFIQSGQLMEGDYPRGKREQVINKMTTIPLQDLKEFNKCQSWKDVYNFHKKHTTWLDDTQINELINLYKAQAASINQRKELHDSQKWRLNDL